MTEIIPIEERWRRHQRDQRAYRRRRLERRMWPRFRRDLGIVPHRFLCPGHTLAAEPTVDRDELLDALRGKAVWTLDVAARLASGRGFLTQRDLTAYLHPDDVAALEAGGVVRSLRPARLSLTPLDDRPPLLVVHPRREPRPSVELEGGHRVVTWDAFAEDLVGVLGWRPEILERLETRYRAATNSPELRPGGGSAGPSPRRP